MEYHKGEWYPYAEKTGRQPTVCQEGYCSSCQIYLDFKEGKVVNDQHKQSKETGQ